MKTQGPMITKLCFLLALTLFLALPTKASRLVKVATIGATPTVNNTDPQKMVEQVIAFWQNQLKQVLFSKPDLIVLPEACDRPLGLSVEAQFEYFKQRKNQVLNYFAKVAKDNHSYIAVGMKRQDEHGLWKNSVVLLDRFGKTIGIYDKNYPTIEEMEAGIKAVNHAPVFNLDFGKVAAIICYDLNFDALRRQFADLKPDLIIFSSVYHGGLEQSNWAYYCRAYFASSISDTRVPSEIRNPFGEVISTSTNYFNYTISTINLDYKLAHLDFNWDKLKALKLKYGPAVTIYDPGKVGSVLITSNDKDKSADQMLKEFNIEPLDNYFERAIKFRKLVD